MSSQKGFGLLFIILSVLIVSGLAAGVYFLTQNNWASTPETSQLKSLTADEIADWKSVTFNKKLTFKIPRIYQSGYLGSGPKFAIDPQPIPQEEQYGDFTPGFTLEVVRSKSLNQIKQEFLDSQVAYEEKTTSEIVVDGKTSLKTMALIPPGQDTVDHHIIDVYIPFGQEIYHFSSFDQHISQSDQEKYFDLILSTFKFTK